MVEKRADFYAQDQTGSTLELHVSYESKTEPKSIAFVIELNLSHIGSSRRQTIRLNGMEYVSLLAMLQQKMDRAYIDSLRAQGSNVLEMPSPAEAPQFGSVFDEPLDTPSGSTAESMVIGALAAAELAEREQKPNLNVWRSDCPKCGTHLLNVRDKGAFDDADDARDGDWLLYPHLCPDQKIRVIPDHIDDLGDDDNEFVATFAAEVAERQNASFPISPEALDDLADKVVSIFEAEDAARATATGTAVGDDGPILDGEVA